MSFENKIQQWVSVDNQIRLLNDKMKELREIKQRLTNDLTDYAEEKDIYRSTIQISDSKLRFATTNVASPLSFSLLKKSLGEIIKNEEQVNQIVEYVKQKREIKVVKELKRTP
jgi:FtsZ-binding cell division protein ZapB